MKIQNFTALKKANRLKADILEIAYFFNEDKEEDFYNLNLLEELHYNDLIDDEEYKQLTELFERIYNVIETAESNFLKQEIEDNKRILKLKTKKRK
jgi:hypothetical protein